MEQPKKDSEKVTFISPASKSGSLTVIIPNAYENVTESKQVQICKDTAGKWMDKVIIKAELKEFSTYDQSIIKAIDKKIEDWRLEGRGINRFPFVRLEEYKTSKATEPETVAVKGKDGEMTFVSIEEIKEALAQKEESERTLGNQQIVHGTITTDKTNKKKK